ncbi:dynein heavy chain, partial [Kipferlia bialata]
AQLLTRTVNLERKELEQQRQALLEEVNANKKDAEVLEEQLLARLSETEGNLLDDDSLIEVLAKTKKMTEEVQEKLRSAVIMEQKINEARREYLPTAT